jgi:hypothetical protein
MTTTFLSLIVKMSIPIDEWPHVGCTPFTYANPTNFTMNVVDNSSVTVNHSESTAHNAFVMPTRVHRLTEHGFKTRPDMQYTNEIAPPAAKRHKLVMPHNSMGVLPRFKPFKDPQPPPPPGGGGGGGGGGGAENISVVFRPRDEIKSTRLAKQDTVLESKQLQEVKSGDTELGPGQLPRGTPPTAASTILQPGRTVGGTLSEEESRRAQAQAAQAQAPAQAGANRRALETGGGDEVVEETGGGDEVVEAQAGDAREIEYSADEIEEAEKTIDMFLKKAAPGGKSEEGGKGEGEGGEGVEEAGGALITKGVQSMASTPVSAKLNPIDSSTPVSDKLRRTYVIPSSQSTPQGEFPQGGSTVPMSHEASARRQS